MKANDFFLLFLVISLLMLNESVQSQDWRAFANLDRYQAANIELGQVPVDEKRVVLMGDSITEGWNYINPVFLEKTGYINRGIGGQTTPQMLLRFREDVVNLKPRVVVILAGTNDIAGNTGPSSVYIDVVGLFEAV